MSGIVKLKDIAEELGVSVVTVSNALSGKKGVSDAVRQKILETAQRMGYDYSKYAKKETDTAKIGVVVEKGTLQWGHLFIGKCTSRLSMLRQEETVLRCLMR